MSNKENGGPAFPTVPGNYINENSLGEGMTLRDYFAAHASEADIDRVMSENVSPEWADERSREPGLWSPVRYTITRQQARYIHADKMLEARKS